MSPVRSSTHCMVAMVTALILAACASPASAARHASLVIELGRSTALRQPVTELQPGESVMWSNHGAVVHRVEIAGRRLVEVQPGAEAVTTFDHPGKWVALDPDLGEVVAVIEVADKR